MPLRISYCPYRLRFKHPFATSHGVREGTDSIFIRLEQDGAVGYGEVTLPPYVAEKPEAVLARLRGAGMTALDSAEKLKSYLDDEAVWHKDEQGCRAALHMAWIDLQSKSRQLSVYQLLNIKSIKVPRTMMTIGVTPVAELSARLQELPESDVLKVKVNGAGSIPMIAAILDLDKRPVFMDANQGLSNLEEAMRIRAACGERLVAMEQPFTLRDNELHYELGRSSKVCIYGDESIQTLSDLEIGSAIFQGVNIKLMKCGGLDRAKRMADRAGELGMKVMLGSMSESSLGCTAMARLAGQAELVDLDGPWLIRNDPFVGVEMKGGKLIMPKRIGIGAILKAELEFSPICA